MTRYKLTIAYHGEKFAGFQEQTGKITIQSKIEAALSAVTKEPVKIMPSGRTDSGVHALNQVIHFDLQKPLTKTQLSPRGFLYNLNNILKPEIVITEMVKAKKDFHAILSAREKTYVYIIDNRPTPNPFFTDYSWQLKAPLDCRAMQKAAKALLGKHDFTAFCATDSAAKSKIRTVKKIKITTTHPANFVKLPHDRFVTITVTGVGFLKQMVRIIVGTLVSVGQGKMSAQDVKKILHSRDRRLAGATAPGQGLFLNRVKY